MSATEAPPAGSCAASPAPPTPDPGRPRRRAVAFLAVALASLAAFVVLTWPLARHLDGIWTMTGNRGVAAEPNFVNRPGGMHGGDHLQNVFIQSVIVDNLRARRSPYLDLREGAAGPAPLKTTSLDLPWTALLALAWPLVGLMAAYNLGLALASVATGLAAFAWLGRHTRWPLLAAAGALAYACTPNRMFQLTGHFNAVMWWAFPAALLAFEVMVERRRAGRPWAWPAAGLAAVTLTVAVSGEFHLILYLAGLLASLATWTLVAGLAGRGGVPWGPLAAVAATLGAASAYVLAVFAYVFRGEVQGSNGSYEPVIRYAPESIRWLVERDEVVFGERLVYVGWGIGALAGHRPGRCPGRPRPCAHSGALRRPAAAAAGVHAWTGRRHRSVPSLPVLLRSSAAPVAAAGAPSADGGDQPGTGAAGRGRPGPDRSAAVNRPALGGMVGHGRDPGRHRPAAAGLCRRPERGDEGRDGQPGGGLPARGWRRGRADSRAAVGRQISPTNSVTTYVAALSRRRALNAYNQTPAPWLSERLRRLRPLNRGSADPAALQLLRSIGITQVVVTNEPAHYEPGQWRSVIDRLVASGHFHLVVSDGPLALLELTDP